MQSKWLCWVVANYSFVFICEHNTLARVLPESSAVICAKFSGVSTNFTATITKCFKKVFCELFFKKAKILLFVTNLQIKIRNSIYKNISSRSNASSTSSLLAKDENLKNPSPCLPNPTPGVPTTPVSFKRRSKKSQDDALNGILNHK